jgi:ribosome-associated toxin RatA of RatAB toxin-antitoxin module
MITAMHRSIASRTLEIVMHFRLHHLVLALVTTFTILFAMPMASHAGDDEATRLERRGRSERYTKATTSPKNSIDTGGAAIYIHAPIDVVRRIVTDYRNYEKTIKSFKTSKLLSRNKGVSEVYLEVPILHGAATVSVVALMGAPVIAGNEERITARMLRGNVDDFRAVWRLRAVDAENTILKLELLVDPSLPAPASLITPELCTASENAVTGVRKQAEKIHRAATQQVVQASQPAGGT